MILIMILILILILIFNSSVQSLGVRQREAALLALACW